MNLKNLLKCIPDNTKVSLTIISEHKEINYECKIHIQLPHCVLRRKVEKLYTYNDMICIEVY